MTQRKLFLGILATGLIYSMQGADNDSNYDFRDKKNVALARTWARTESPMDLAVFVHRSQLKRDQKMLNKMHMQQNIEMRERPLFVRQQEVLQSCQQLTFGLRNNQVSCGFEFLAGICDQLHNEKAYRYTQHLQAAKIFAECAYYAAKNCVPTEADPDTMRWMTLKNKFETIQDFFAQRVLQEYGNLHIKSTKKGFFLEDNPHETCQSLQAEKEKVFLHTPQTLSVLAECAYRAWKSVSLETCFLEETQRLQETKEALRNIGLDYFDNLHHRLPKNVDLSDQHGLMIDELCGITPQEEAMFITEPLGTPLAAVSEDIQEKLRTDRSIFKSYERKLWKTFILEKSTMKFLQQDLSRICQTLVIQTIPFNIEEYRDFLLCSHTVLTYAQKQKDGVNTYKLGEKCLQMLQEAQKNDAFFTMLCAMKVPVTGYEDKGGKLPMEQRFAKEYGMFYKAYDNIVQNPVKDSREISQCLDRGERLIANWHDASETLFTKPGLKKMVLMRTKIYMLDMLNVQFALLTTDKEIEEKQERIVTLLLDIHEYVREHQIIKPNPFEKEIDEGIQVTSGPKIADLSVRAMKAIRSYDQVREQKIWDAFSKCLYRQRTKLKNRAVIKLSDGTEFEVYDTKKYEAALVVVAAK